MVKHFKIGCLVLFVVLSASMVSFAAEVTDFGPTPGSGLISVSAPKHAGTDFDAVWQREIKTHAVLMGQRSIYLEALQAEGSEIGKTKIFEKNGKEVAKMLVWLEQSVKIQAVAGTSPSRMGYKIWRS